MIVGFKAAQDKGKTSLMVLTCLELVALHGYWGDECYGNLVVRIPGFNAKSSAELVETMKVMVKERWRHKVLLLDEVDRVFPHRFWQDKEQTRALLGLWQDVKLFNWVLWTAHLGGAVDILLRECTQTVVIPVYHKEADMTEIGIIDTWNLRVGFACVPRVSRVFGWYDRWATVD